MAKRVHAMPEPGTKRAPEYDSRYPEELEDFLEDFEELAWKYELTSREKSKVIVKYADCEMKARWKKLEGYNESYRLLKKKIMKTYRNNKKRSKLKKGRKLRRDETSDDDSDSEVSLSEEDSEWEAERRSIIDEVGELVKQLTSLRVTDTLYASTFAKLKSKAPTVAVLLPPPAGQHHIQPSTMLPYPSFPRVPVMRRTETSNKNSDETSDESDDETSGDSERRGMTMRENEMLRSKTEEIRKKVPEEEGREVDVHMGLSNSAAIVVATTQMSKESPIAQDPVPSSRDDKAIANVSDTQTAVNNKLTNKDTRTSKELTVLVQNSSDSNIDTVTMDPSDTRTATDHESTQENSRMVDELTGWTQSPLHVPGMSLVTIFNVRVPVMKPNDGGVEFEGDKIEDLSGATVEREEMAGVTKTDVQNDESDKVGYSEVEEMEEIWDEAVGCERMVEVEEDGKETTRKEAERATKQVGKTEQETERVQKREEKVSEDKGSEENNTYQPTNLCVFETTEPKAQHHTLRRIPGNGIPYDNTRGILLFGKNTHQCPKDNTHTLESHLELATSSEETEVQGIKKLEERILSADDKNVNANSRDDLLQVQGMEMDVDRWTIMEIANMGTNEARDVKSRELEVDVKVDWACERALVVPRASFRVLLEVPWWKGVRLKGRSCYQSRDRRCRGHMGMTKLGACEEFDVEVVERDGRTGEPENLGPMMATGTTVRMYTSAFVVQQMQVQTLLEIPWKKGVRLKIGRCRNRSELYTPPRLPPGIRLDCPDSSRNPGGIQEFLVNENIPGGFLEDSRWIPGGFLVLKEIIPGINPPGIHQESLEFLVLPFNSIYY
ncbi:hypothetical protein BYT27DRAFT_7209974 [Phlegmacium glaucopus]|nr:hypothetical protein BYT27DRAFT_7209974 [Phlegmacium glaucopus]